MCGCVEEIMFVIRPLLQPGDVKCGCVGQNEH